MMTIMLGPAKKARLRATDGQVKGEKRHTRLVVKYTVHLFQFLNQAYYRNAVAYVTLI